MQNLFDYVKNNTFNGEFLTQEDITKHLITLYETARKTKNEDLKNALNLALDIIENINN